MSTDAQHVGPSTPRRKLIEVSIPLQKINEASAREKSIRHGHPSTLHLWWSRKPLATARAVLFAQLVDDPASRPDLYPTEEQQVTERKKLFELIERLVVWENSNDEALLREAHQKILESTDGNPPPILDPFAGGGSIPLEAQRLGLEAHASDLNPVAVLINKALIEIPPKFVGQRPVFPGAAEETIQDWPRATGLAEDVRRYGQWMRDEAEKRIGHLYPKATLPDGSEATVIAWIWARTVICPNPECRIEMPLTSNWWLSKKPGNEAFLMPKVDDKVVSFEIGHDKSNLPTSRGTVSGRTGAVCIRCGSHATADEVHRQLDIHNKPEMTMTAIVTKGNRGRHYMPADPEHIRIARSAAVEATALRESTTELTAPSRGTFGSNAQGRRYGFFKFSDYFTDRQFVTMVTLSDLTSEVHRLVLGDARSLPDARSYANAVTTYVSLAVSRTADYSSSACSWNSARDLIRNVFSRQAIPIIWDPAETNIFSSSAGNFLGQVAWVASALERISPNAPGTSRLANAATMPLGETFSTDPPYYDNVGYSDLSDYFYVWLRRCLHDIYPEIFGTLLVPKSDELVANKYRHGSEKAAQEFFENGFVKFFEHARANTPSLGPRTVYYAFKQQHIAKDGISSTGWATLLEGISRSGWQITATWPMRTEGAGRLLAQGTNALASSIVLALRPRPDNAPRIDRRGFISILKSELPDKLRELQQGSIAPVDLPQAAIGPGMAVFSRYSAVLEDDGSKMTVRTALQRINAILDEVLTELENDFDSETRFALAWFRQNAFSTGIFGDAESIANARGVSLDFLERAGILTKGGGKVALIAPDDMPADYDPSSDDSISQWEVVMHLTRVLASDGIPAASALLGQVPMSIDRELCKELAHLLFKLAEDQKKTALAVHFNSLGAAWNDIARGAESMGQQQTLS